MIDNASRNGGKDGGVRGRDRERSALAGWPDDHEADLYRDDRRSPEHGLRSEPSPPREPEDRRDPQVGFWGG